VGNTGYVVEFLSTPENFSTSENVEIRDRFIKSINFIGLNNTTDANGRISRVAKLQNNSWSELHHQSSGSSVYYGLPKFFMNVFGVFMYIVVGVINISKYL
jgi:hypothetical protein